MTFPWIGGKSGKNDLEEKRNLERDLAAQVKARQKAERQIDELRKAYDAAESRYQQACIDNRNMAAQHEDKIAMLTIEHSKTTIEHLKNMSDAKNAYGRDTDILKKRHSIDLENLKNNHRKEASRFQDKIEKLKGQLLVNQDNNQGWPDDKLEIQFRELQRLIESVTSPSNKEFFIPLNQQVGSHLDPTNFLHRAGNYKSHLLLKNAIWTILHEQFFGAPFGFGALGPGEAHTELTEVYSTWRRLFDRPPEMASSNGEDFTIFNQDKLANKWRSANFQCIGVALEAINETNPAPGSLLAKLSADNFHLSISRIMATLSEVSRLSNTSIRSEVEDQIRRLVSLAGDIALQFGVQTAQLRLLVPKHGSYIQIGEEFHDCEDGDCYKGSVCEVDLVIVPGLQKIGDGRSDMSSKRTIVPCEIYSHEPPS